MAKRRKTSKTKRTIFPEHLAKMQEGRKNAKVHRERVSELHEHGLDKSIGMTNTERMLQGVKRK